MLRLNVDEVVEGSTGLTSAETEEELELERELELELVKLNERGRLVAMNDVDDEELDVTEAEEDEATLLLEETTLLLEEETALLLEEEMTLLLLEDEVRTGRLEELLLESVLEDATEEVDETEELLEEVDGQTSVNVAEVNACFIHQA